MLNINPMNNYSKSNINFKSQKDFSKIYKEMEKITLTQEEKIIPKQNKIKNVFPKKKFNISSKITNCFKNLKEFFEVYKPVIFVSGLTLAAIITCLIPSADKKSQQNSNNIELVNNSNKELESIAFEKADLLENMYKNGSISFSEYRAQMQDISLNYDVKSHMNLLQKAGYNTNERDLNKVKEKYYHDNNGKLVLKNKITTIDNVARNGNIKNRQTYSNTDYVTDVNCQEIDKNIEILKEKLRRNEETQF